MLGCSNRSMRTPLITVLALLSAGCRRDPPVSSSVSERLTGSGYVEAVACAGCHAEIYRKYRQTGMGRSFSPASKEKMFEDFSRRPSFYHQASNRHYTMIERRGRYFQRRHQTTPEGGTARTMEKEIHFVMGSGNHARTYLHRTAGGKLIELPLGWYAERGGSWAMSPGYDRRDHPEFRRAISDDCMFCHNGYPRLEAGSRDHGADALFPGKLPDGIDCQRCHGPGRGHVEAAGAGRPKDEIRRLILNPAKLNAQRQLELCMQCHLESTSRALPYSIVRFDRQPYSYDPREPLADFILHFDFAPGKGPDDHFEIAHAAYRLRKSKCFTEGGGKLVCTTCHDPHEAKRGVEAEKHYSEVCRSCHAKAHSNDRARANNCVSCHMAKRRTDDVVHVAMTDHLIRKRQPNRDPLAPLVERHETAATAYRGPVAPYYPAALPRDAAGELYLATAQVYAGANFATGIAQLRAAIERHRPREPEFYHQVAEAYFRTGQDELAASYYRQALERDPRYLPAIRNLGATLTRLGRFPESIEVLRRAPADPAALNNLGEALLAHGQPGPAAQALRRAVELDPDSPEALNNLGRALARTGDSVGAEQQWLAAIRVKPDFALAHNNLANRLDQTGRWGEAQRHFEEALQDPSYAIARFNFGTALAQRGQMELAERQLLEAVRLDPRLADAHLNLGMIEATRGRPARAAVHFQAALLARPDFGRARVNLGFAMAELGRTADALKQFRAASQDPDPDIRSKAQQAIQQLAAGK